MRQETKNTTPKIGIIIAIIIFPIVAIHLYFYFAHGSFDPCETAVNRMIATEKSAEGRVLGAAFSSILLSIVQSKGTLNCYRVSIIGPTQSDLSLGLTNSSFGNMPSPLDNYLNRRR